MAEHLSGLLARQILTEDRWPPEKRSTEVELLAHLSGNGGDGDGYDPLIAEFDAAADADEDPFAEVNRRRKAQ